MPNFDEAIRATEEMFANEETAPPAEEVPQEAPAEVPQEVPVDGAVLEEENRTLNAAVDTAEAAAMAAQQKDMQLQQAMQDIEMLRQQNQEMLGTIEQLSQKNEEQVIEKAMEMPSLDINGLAFADEETVAQAQAEYAQKMAEFVRGGVMQELEPFVNQAKEGMYQKEKDATLSALAQVPELQGIQDMIPQLDKIIANNKWLQSEDMPIEEKFINAFAIARGVNAINTPVEEPHEMTDDEFMELYDKNPTFQELIEKKRLSAIKNSQQVPPFSASSGAVNAALNIDEKPKTFEEASERTRKMFGLG